MMELKVGSIGLGTMGGAMCGHLIDGGVPTSVCSKTTSATALWPAFLYPFYAHGPK
jgi:3-hydroxyisobutyrate dehydrogenase-like beta-hydroxyacid dehydrogenase